jgi:hypothetical protein
MAGHFHISPGALISRNDRQQRVDAIRTPALCWHGMESALHFGCTPHGVYFMVLREGGCNNGVASAQATPWCVCTDTFLPRP